MTTGVISHDAIVPHLSKETLQDIEGLDATVFGFGRDECCEPLPAKLPGSMVLTEHIFLAANMRPTQWDSKLGNVPGYSALEEALKSVGDAKLTVYHRPGPDVCVLCFKYNEALESMLITQYSCVTEGVLPWDSKGSVSCDRSNEVFIFVCCHRARDKRCGYCGAILVDLLRQAIKTKKCDNESIHVYPCSHVGGHMYAGNVLMYTRDGGVCFGCFTAGDVDDFVNSIVTGMDIPSSLERRVRGRIGFSKKYTRCCVV